MFHVPVPMNRFGRRLPGFTELFLSTFPQKSFTSFLLLLLFSLKIKNRTTKQWPSPLFLFPVLTRFSFEERGDLFDFLFFFLGYGDGWRPTWRRLKKKKMAADFLPSLKKKNNGYSYVSIWNNQINRSIQSIGKFDWKKKLALKSRVTACKSAKKKRKKLLDDNKKKKEAHAVTVKLRQLRTTWRTSGPFELVRQRHIFSKFLFFSYFEMFGVGSFCLLPSPEEKKNSFGATIFLLLLFSRPSPFILFDFFYFFFGCT